MAQFYLHIHNDHGDAEDEEGIQAKSLSEARELAIAGIRSLLSAEVTNGELNLNGRIDISDETRTVVLKVPFAEALTIRGR